MRKYTLASPAARAQVDLQDYQELIQDSVHEVLPKAVVKVEKGCYYVSPTPSQGEAIKIGRLICQSALREYCIQIPKLFSSIALEEVDEHEAAEKKHLGGHQ